MDEQLITHMRKRVEQLRKVQALAHDPRIMKLVQEVIDTVEADIARLEQEARQGGAESEPAR